MTELQLYDIQCKASGDLLFTLEAPDVYSAVDRVLLAYEHSPHLPRPIGNYLVYDHDPNAFVTVACLREGFFQLLEAQAATKH